MTWFGPQCPRCETRNKKEAEYCEHCGISMAAPRPAILKGNRWEAAPDEFAVFFKGRDVKGLFSKNMHVPSGMRGWVLQDNRVEELQEGEYSLETLPERLNSLFTGKHAEILIARQNANSIPFRFDDIPSAEMLSVTVEANIHVRVGGLEAFRNHFMLRPGAVTVPQLRELLNDSVRQIIVETLGGRHLEEMSTQNGLRDELAAKLRAGLAHRFNDFGLAFDAVDALRIHHDRFDANRNLMGSLWLDQDEARKKAEHQRSLDELYSQQEWAKIKAREEDLRRRYEHADLTEKEAELGYVIRIRELDRFEKISKSNTREEAIRAGARDAVETLEHDYQAKRREREQKTLGSQYQSEDAVTAWRRTREIAGIRHEAELKVENLRKDAADAIERRRIAISLEKMRIEGEIDTARLVDDVEERKRQQADNAELMMYARLREQSLLDARHRLAIDEVETARAVKQREAARIQAWEDKVLEEKLAEIDLRIDGDKSDQGLSKLEKMIRMKEQNDLSQVRLQLEQIKVDLFKRRELQTLENEAAEKALDRDLIKRQADRDALLDSHEHEKEMVRIKGSLPPEALISLTDNPQALAAILELAKTKVLVTASPEHIRAILATAMQQPASSPYAAAAPQAAAAPASDPLADALHTQNQELRDIFEKMNARDDRKWENVLRTIENITQEVGKAAVGVAQAHGNAPQKDVAAPASQPAQHTAAPAAAHFSVPFGLKQCPICQGTNTEDAIYCGKCRAAF